MAATIAVIVPAHDRADQLDVALTSVERQTVTDLEIIVVDDASSDHTPDVCRRHQEADPRVRVIRHETNGGAARARNTGIDATDATYVAFMDGDDHAEPRWLEDLLTVARAEDVPMVAAGHVLDLDGTLTVPSVPVDRTTLVPGDDVTVHPRELLYAMGFCWNTLYRRDAIGDVRFDPARPLFEDTVFNLDLMERVERAAFVPSAQYHYVQHGAARLTNRPQVPDLGFRAELTRRYDAQCEAWGLSEQVRDTMTALAGWGVGVEAARTTPPGVDAVATLRASLEDEAVQWLLQRADGPGLRRVDRPVVEALRAGRVRRARALARGITRLASARAQVGMRLAARRNS